jgi:hypothetical protein
MAFVLRCLPLQLVRDSCPLLCFMWTGASLITLHIISFAALQAAGGGGRVAIANVTTRTKEHAIYVFLKPSATAVSVSCLCHKRHVRNRQGQLPSVLLSRHLMDPVEQPAHLYTLLALVYTDAECTCHFFSSSCWDKWI